MTAVATDQRRPMGRPRALTRDRVIGAAIELADAEGLDAVSIRNLAALLSVRPGTIYSYVRSKDDLVAAMIERLLLSIDVPQEEPGPDWRGEFAALVTSYYEVLVAYPYLLSPDLIVEGAIPTAAHLAERCLLLLECGGYRGPQAWTPLATVMAYVVGSASADVWAARALARLSNGPTYDPERFPRLAAAFNSAKLMTVSSFNARLALLLTKLFD